jgi:hypothetical protein
MSSVMLNSFVKTAKNVEPYSTLVCSMIGLGVGTYVGHANPMMITDLSNATKEKRALYAAAIGAGNFCLGFTVGWVLPYTAPIIVPIFALSSIYCAVKND